MTDDYDAADDSRKSYDVCIAAMGEKLRSFRREQIGDATLYLGDCREILPLLPKVDAVVTDPPYGIDYGNKGSFQASHGWRDLRENLTWDTERPPPEIITALLACSEDQIIWGGNYFSDMLPPTMQWLIWDKGQFDFSLADFEMAWSSQEKAARRIVYGRGRAVQDGKVHPTQKPVEVMKWCIEQLPDKCKTVLDPFMGSGTTGVACAALGKHFTGIEREPKYFDIACKRIDDAYRQPRLFKDEAPKAKQEALAL